MKRINIHERNNTKTPKQYKNAIVGYVTSSNKNALSFVMKSVSYTLGPVAQSVWRLIYGLDGPGSNPGGDEIFQIGRAHV